MGIIKKLLKDYKTYLVIVGAVAGILTVLNFPLRLEAVEEKVKKVENSSKKETQDLKDIFQQYISTSEKNMIRQNALLENEINNRKEDKKDQLEREAWMLKLLDKMSKIKEEED